MEEAKYSLNIRFNIKGYDSQFTARDDESGVKLLKMVPQVLQELEKLGAVPERRWEEARNGNGNGHHSNGKPAQNGAVVLKAPAPEPEPKPAPECPLHGKAKIKESKFGGLYCAAKLKDGGFCDWKSE